jgi:hypothetical protein
MSFRDAHRIPAERIRKASCHHLKCSLLRVEATVTLAVEAHLKRNKLHTHLRRDDSVRSRSYGF